jgi:uncharacterized flavoprotein (TIGR03862 family)
LHKAVIIGAGPAGLMAAEVLASAGVAVDIFDAMPSPGRKFLLAGIGGMNITHAEDFELFLTRFGNHSDTLRPLLQTFDSTALRAWIHALGIETFIGSSGRVFPAEMKAAPLLRAWLHRLRSLGVKFHTRHRWLGWADNGALHFRTTNEGSDLDKFVQADTTVLALGGASWPRLGSDGAWHPLLQARGVVLAPLLPANCGFEVAWSAHFTERFAGEPLKTVQAHTVHEGKHYSRKGECLITATGIEGSLIYALSAPLRDEILANGSATLLLDLAPGRIQRQLERELSLPRGKDSFSNHLRKRAGIAGVKAGLLRECVDEQTWADPVALAAAIKALPITLTATRPLHEAISTAGGVCFAALDEQLMLQAIPGVFCAGEMLDWEAPTGGYLLNTCFASGRAAGLGAANWLQKHPAK